MEEVKSQQNDSPSPVPPPPFEESNYPDGSYDHNNSGNYDSRFMSHSGTKMSQDDSALSPEYRDTNDSYPSLRRVASHGSFSRRSFDESNYIDARMHKLIQSEAAIREEMFRDCTFQPKIKGLPTVYGPLKEHGTPFVVRVNKWNKEKELEKKNKAKLAVESQLKDCTFKPKISKHSSAAIKEIRGESSPDRANGRLYYSHKAMLEAKDRMRNEEQEKEQRINDLECTFHPVLETRDNPAFQHINPKFKQPHIQESLKEKKKQLEEKYYKGFTFTPKVNKIKGNMTSVKMYVKANVVDRLTKPLPSSDTTDGQDDLMKAFDTSFEGQQSLQPRVVMDAATFLGSLAPSGGSVKGGGSPSGTVATGGKAVTTEKRIDAQEFDKFLQRQNLVLQRREDQKKTLERAMTPNFKPKITRKSVDLTRNHSTADFLSRVERDVQRRSAMVEQSHELRQLEDAESTFRPKINARAAAQRSRSSFEMSRGDLLKKETSRRMLKLQMEQEELSKMTFKPEISNRAREYGRSALKINENPSEFLKWTKERAEQKEREREEKRLQLEREELAKCTFAPKTSTCPAYISRIAESMKNLKSARSSVSLSGDKPKADWR